MLLWFDCVSPEACVGNRTPNATVLRSMT
jgi:hypothetical protein